MNEDRGYIYRVAPASREQLLELIETHVGDNGWAFGGAAQWDFEPSLEDMRKHLRPIERFAGAVSIKVEGDSGHVFGESAEVRWKRRDDGAYDVLILKERAVDGQTTIVPPCIVRMPTGAAY